MIPDQELFKSNLLKSKNSGLSTRFTPLKLAYFVAYFAIKKYFGRKLLPYQNRASKTFYQTQG